MDEEKALELVEYGVEALLLGAFTYLFAYQNYLLYRWHRGLPLPAKWPFILLGLAVGLGFFLYKSWRILEENGEKPRKVEPEPETTDSGQSPQGPA